MPVPARLGFRLLSGHQLTSWMVDWPALGGDWLSLVVPLANRLYHSFSFSIVSWKTNNLHL
ncbi:hypothetical protein Hanom_Chr15g01387111 [Helianthus anomalus]